MSRDVHPRIAERAASARDPRLALVHAFATLWLEVEAGRRAPAQLFWLMDARLVARVAGRVPRRDGVPGEVRAVSGAQPAPGRFEAVAVVARGGRSGALALRLAHDEDGWKVTEVASPEEPSRPGLGVVEDRLAS